MFVPEENALLEFDAYSSQDDRLQVAIEVGDMEHESERYVCSLKIAGGGKWKRIILKAGDFKGCNCGRQLKNFSDGKALVFDCEKEETEFAITNILWL